MPTLSISVQPVSRNRETSLVEVIEKPVSFVSLAQKERNRLQIAYGQAEAQERAAWRMLNDPSFRGTGREEIYACWKIAAARTKELALRLQDLPGEG